MNGLLNRGIIGNNTLYDFIWFFGILLAGLLFKHLLSRLFTFLIFQVLQKYTHGVSSKKLFDLLERPVGAFIIITTVYIASQHLTFPLEWKLAGETEWGVRLILKRLFLILISLSITWIFLRMVDFLGIVLLERAAITDTKNDDQLIPFIKESVKVVIVVFSIFIILSSVFNVNIVSLIAGLGIGGLAVALAAKESLENLLGSFTIFLDKPFVVGDNVQVGSYTGSIESIGFRSTRIRTSDKSLVTIPNKKMVDGELNNLTLRTQRRAHFTIGLNYTASLDNIKNIIRELQTYFDEDEHIQSSESHVELFELSPSAISIAVEFYVLTNKNHEFLLIKQAVNFYIMELVAKYNCSFASTTNITVSNEATVKNPSPGLQ